MNGMSNMRTLRNAILLAVLVATALSCSRSGDDAPVAEGGKRPPVPRNAAVRAQAGTGLQSVSASVGDKAQVAQRDKPDGSELLAPADGGSRDAFRLQKQAVEEFEKLQEAYTDDSFSGKIAEEDSNALLRALNRLEGKDREVALKQTLDLLDDKKYALVQPILLNAAGQADDLEILYHDLLNRPDEIKYPLLRQMAKTEGHPMAQDAADVLDATGEADK